MKTALLQLALLVAVSTTALAAPDEKDLFDMSLEELMQITVTTAEKLPQAYLETPAPFM
jgi:hypothetical protein